jgi:hypothetical protein
MAIEWEPAYTSAYSVRASVDGQNWTTIFSTTTGNGGVDTIATGGLIARFIEIHCPIRATPYGISIWEVRFDSPVRCYADPRSINFAAWWC